MGASLNSVVTQQPINNNHLPPRDDTGREINELPLHADKLYEVGFSFLIGIDDLNFFCALLVGSNLKRFQGTIPIVFKSTYKFNRQTHFLVYIITTFETVEKI